MKKNIKHDSLMFNIGHKIMTALKTLPCATAHMQDNSFTFCNDHVTRDLP